MHPRATERARVAALAATLLALPLACFPKAPGPRLTHFEATAPAPGQPAPGFTLPDLAGGEIRLSERVAGRPLVLALGSESCPVFRHRRHWLHALVRSYRGRVDFLAVYTREAHPVDAPSPYTGEEWDLWVNRLSGVRVGEPASLAERVAQARRAADAMSLRVDVAVDRMDDAVWRAYRAASAPVFVVDRDGRIAARQVWSDPSALREVLDGLLAR